MLTIKTAFWPCKLWICGLLTSVINWYSTKCNSSWSLIPRRDSKNLIVWLVRVTGSLVIFSVLLFCTNIFLNKCTYGKKGNNQSSNVRKSQVYKCFSLTLKAATWYESELQPKTSFKWKLTNTSVKDGEVWQAGFEKENALLTDI